jgi:hypothetical protein
MRQTIELLRKQSIQAGLTQAHMQSMGVQQNGTSNGNASNAKSPPSLNGSPIKSISTNGHHEQNIQQQQQQCVQNGNMQRQHSTDSMCSNDSNDGSTAQEKKKKKGWVSFA